MTRVLIADDHSVVRAGLKEILAGRKDFFGGEARTGQEVLEAVQKEAWDLVILDISLPDKNGLDVLKELRISHPHLPVLVLSMHPEDQFALRTLKAGAAGYMTKETAPEELLGAVTKVLNGGKYISPALSDKLASRLGQKTSDQPHELLSDREYQILCLIASGKTPTEIGKMLKLSVKTISTYRERMLQKMGMKSNGELMRYAIENKLV